MNHYLSCSFIRLMEKYMTLAQSHKMTEIMIVLLDCAFFSFLTLMIGVLLIKPLLWLSYGLTVLGLYNVCSIGLLSEGIT